MKTLLSIFAASFVVTFLLVSAPAGACACMPPPYIDQISGQQGPAEPGLYSATTQDEWETLWAMIGEEPKGAFEEGETTAVAYFMGLRPTGGYEAYASTHWEDTFVRVDFEEMIPTGIVTQALTTPYTIVILDGVAETVFDENYIEISSPISHHKCDEPMEMEQRISHLTLDDVVASLRRPALI